MKERFEVLDIFRGIFSSLVVFFHLSTFSDTPIINNNFVYNSDLFVDFFFVLSGFVITYSYQLIKSNRELGHFYQKRFFRLYPLHIIMFLLFVVIELPKHFVYGYVHVNKIVNESNNLASAISNVFLLNSVKLPGINDVSWNIASWSISAEMIAYLVFGLIALFINRIGLLKVRTTIYLLVVLLTGFFLHWLTGGGKLVYSFDFGFLRGILGFFIGCVCFCTFDSLKDYFRSFNKVIFTIWEIILIITTITLVWLGSAFKDYGYIYEVLFFITILIFSFEKGLISDWLKRSTFLHRVGKYSYSIYMTHTLILSLFNVLFVRILKFPPSAYAYLFILNYALIYWASAWTFKNIEMRFNQISFAQKDKKAWWLW